MLIPLPIYSDLGGRSCVLRTTAWDVGPRPLLLAQLPSASRIDTHSLRVHSSLSKGWATVSLYACQNFFGSARSTQASQRTPLTTNPQIQDLSTRRNLYRGYLISTSRNRPSWGSYSPESVLGIASRDLGEGGVLRQEQACQTLDSGPKGHVNTSILHSGSKAPNKLDSRNPCFVGSLFSYTIYHKFYTIDYIP